MKARRWWTWPVAAILIAVVLFALDRLFPPPLPDHAAAFATVVTAADGSPLRAFADDEGVWRYPTTPQAVSPLYREALINYEDRWFAYHPGVNPWALLRAASQWLRHGGIVSGGSTLTMQVARLFEPGTRSLAGKTRQMLRALQLEWRFSKDEILALYLNYAPFGGPLEGVQAASYAYLGKPATELTHAEAALLAVLPQRPSALRPDRHPERARAARDKVLRRLADLGVWSREVVDDALREPIAVWFRPHPRLAPLLARRLRELPGSDGAVRSTLDIGLQQALEERALNAVNRLPARQSLAILVVENATREVRAYLGSADFMDAQRYGHVDMVQARRSPGSLLKPLLFGLAIDQGLIHTGSLLIDAPRRFAGGYRPANFSEGFSGPVSATEALQRSLNLPAVQVLDALGPEVFHARLRDAGLRLYLPPGAQPNLSMILGGAAARLEDLVGAYTALADGGLAAMPRFTVDDALEKRRLLSPGAAWMVRWMLADNPRRPSNAGRSQLAWKTGTSYGYRDAWAIGVGAKYTIGVWAGRPDGTPSPGQYGAVSAAPLLFDIAATLREREPLPPPPENVSEADICWPLGNDPATAAPELCQRRLSAWLLDGARPRTLPGDAAEVLHVRAWKDADSGQLSTPECPAAQPVAVEIARWPSALNPWLSRETRQRSRLPSLPTDCEDRTAVTAGTTAAIRIENPPDGSVLRPPAGGHGPIQVAFLSSAGEGRVYWLLDGAPIGSSVSGVPLHHRFTRGGRHAITVFDERGAWADAEIHVDLGER
ncbi:MAG: penicillin-binding protein 1C [Gammaproteobacteria bacterium]|nr:penicillin-binding protein 1C [Gammaproteobacteria bacterium]